MQVRLHLGNAHQKQRSVITNPVDRLLQIRPSMLLQIRVIQHPNFLQNIFPCCWNDLPPFVSPLFQFSTVFSVSSFYLRVNMVVVYQFTVTCVENWRVRSKGSRLRLCFRFVDDDSGRKEWICEHVFVFFFFWLGQRFTPSLQSSFSFCTQPAFYSQSAFYTQSVIYPWSAVCVLQWPFSQSGQCKTQTADCRLQTADQG